MLGYTNGDLRFYGSNIESMTDCTGEEVASEDSDGVAINEFTPSDVAAAQ